MYYKILREDMTHHGFQYKEGLNEDLLEFNSSPECGAGGLFFADIKNILNFCGYGTKIADVTLPDGELLIEVDDCCLKKYKAHRIILSNIRNLFDVDTLKELVDSGADIHANNDDALRWAAKNGHFEIVKYLVESGADIHANNDDALRWAAKNGHFETVKYLVESGADIHANNDDALRWAAIHGYSDVVEYLKKLY